MLSEHCTRTSTVNTRGQGCPLEDFNVSALMLTRIKEPDVKKEEKKENKYICHIKIIAEGVSHSV